MIIWRLLHILSHSLETLELCWHCVCTGTPPWWTLTHHHNLEILPVLSVEVQQLL
jgi:hypothetical protein